MNTPGPPPRGAGHNGPADGDGRGQPAWGPAHIVDRYLGGRRHAALVYSGESELTGALVPILCDAASAGVTLVAAVERRTQHSIQTALDMAGAGIELPVARWDPGACVVRDFLSAARASDAAASGGGVLVVAEQPGGEHRWQAAARTRYEAAANLHLSAGTLAVCLHDSSALSPEVLGSMRRSHPTVIEGGAGRPSDAFEEPMACLRGVPPGCDGPHHHDADHAVASSPLDVATDIAPTRALVRERALSAGLGAEVVDALVLAMSEIAANALRHGRPPCRADVFVCDGAFVCRIHDAGTAMVDPAAGYAPPPAGATSGRGLWIARQLTDAVETSSGPRGTDVSLYTVLVPAG